MQVINTLRFILSHPLNESDKFAAMVRWLKWQIESRLFPGPISVPFVGEARLLVESGMTGATGNIYCGLHEFTDMAFLLHFLQPEELFLDVGANVGSYTILASKVVGARVKAVEPIPETFDHLTDNINLNQVHSIVQAENIALGATDSFLTMTADQDTTNHAVSASDKDGETVNVPVKRMDNLVGDQIPALIKIDVEGYETEVLKGGQHTLASPDCKAVIMELNGSGNRYGFDEMELHQSMIKNGYYPYEYHPFERKLIALSSNKLVGGNTLYLRDIETAQHRIKNAPKISVLGKFI